MVAVEAVVVEAVETQAMAAKAAMAAVPAAAAGRAAPHYEGGRSKQTSGRRHQQMDKTQPMSEPGRRRVQDRRRTRWGQRHRIQTSRPSCRVAHCDTQYRHGSPHN